MKITAFHGSGISIDVFDYQYTEMGNDQLGSGFYFTSNIEEAEGYCFNLAKNQNAGKAKPGGMHDKTVHKAELEFKKPIKSGMEMVFTVKDITAIIKKSPDLKDNLSNWGEVEFDGVDKLIREAAESYSCGQQSVPVLQTLFSLHNDFFDGHPRAFFEAVREQYGFDGVIYKFENGHTHYVAWFNEQINVIERISLVDTYRKEAPDIGDVEDPKILEGMLLYHGTDMDSALDILNNGIDIAKTTKGYFGYGYYTTPDEYLARSNYAEMADGEAAIVVSKLKSAANIVDARTEHGFEVIKKLERHFGGENLIEMTKALGVDGLFDRSFGGIVIYNPNVIETIGLLPLAAKPKITI